ncbi:hypothetical protein CEUSTIGMA_g11762.t1, partial [Chlamydomonas eustigma]
TVWIMWHAGGSSGWQAPEQLLARDGGAVRQTRSMDVFSLGCVLYYVITGGCHPFGDSYARDSNILHRPPDMSLLKSQVEALNLLSAMLIKDATLRPSMPAVLSHPLWWGAEKQLQFLVDISDRVENEDREPDQALLSALELYSSSACGNNWGSHVHPELVANLGRYRRYDYTSLRDLLRVMRNKRSHFREMPAPLQTMLGPLPHGFLRYFMDRFPHLLLAMFVFALRNLKQDGALAHYWVCGVEACEPFVTVFDHVYNLGAFKVHTRSGEGVKAVSNTASPLKGALDYAKAAQGLTTWEALSSKPDLGDSLEGARGLTEFEITSLHESGTDVSSTPSKYSLPAAAPVASPAHAPASPMVIVGYEVAAGDAAAAGPTWVREFPRRPGKQLCDFYVKTGHCKFGEVCVYDHPEQYKVLLSTMGLPLRPDQPLCAFYLKNNECKYGSACRFHHPLLVPVYAGSAATDIDDPL